MSKIAKVPGNFSVTIFLLPGYPVPVLVLGFRSVLLHKQWYKDHYRYCYYQHCYFYF
jgi:hypothetical protein